MPRFERVPQKQATDTYHFDDNLGIILAASSVWKSEQADILMEVSEHGMSSVMPVVQILLYVFNKQNLCILLFLPTNCCRSSTLCVYLHLSDGLTFFFTTVLLHTPSSLLQYNQSATEHHCLTRVPTIAKTKRGMFVQSFVFW